MSPKNFSSILRIEKKKFSPKLEVREKKRRAETSLLISRNFFDCELIINRSQRNKFSSFFSILLISRFLSCLFLLLLFIQFDDSLKQRSTKTITFRRTIRSKFIRKIARDISNWEKSDKNRSRLSVETDSYWVHPWTRVIIEKTMPRVGGKFVRREKNCFSKNRKKRKEKEEKVERFSFEFCLCNLLGFFLV